MLRIEQEHKSKPTFNVNKIVIKQTGKINKALIRPKKKQAEVQAIIPKEPQETSNIIFEIYQDETYISS